MKKNILVLSYYFPPDLGAGSFRTEDLVNKLDRDEVNSITVICTYPNRYYEYNVKASKIEAKSKKIKVIRIPTYKHKNSFFGQFLSFVIYFFCTLKETREINYDVVYSTSSRLFTAFLGAVVSKVYNKPLYLDIRDIFIESLSSILRGYKLKVATYIFKKIESFTIKQASRINLVSPGFKSYFEDYDINHFSTITNGIDNVFLDYDFSSSGFNKQSRLKVLYAGNVGAGQRLEYIIPYVAGEVSDIAEFIIIGDGSSKKVLMDRCSELDNVLFLEPVSRIELLEHYKNSDVLFLSLDFIPCFERVIPSKIFEYASTGKPIIASVHGYSREFILEHLDNCFVVDNEPQSIIKIIERGKDKFKPSERTRFINEFRREFLSEQLACDVIKFIKGC